MYLESSTIGWMLTRVVLVAGVSALAGCAMDGAPEPAPPSGDVVSFSGEIQPIFDANCTTCHRDGGLAALAGIAMRLTADEAYDSLVGRPSSQDASLTLVEPGDAEASLLFRKVSSDSPPVGRRMPLFSGPLSASEVGLIRDWIDQGAEDN